MIGIPVGLAMLLVCALWCGSMTSCKRWKYLSGVEGRYIPTNYLRWRSAGVTPGMPGNAVREQNRRRQKNQLSQWTE